MLRVRGDVFRVRKGAFRTQAGGLRAWGRIQNEENGVQSRRSGPAESFAAFWDHKKTGGFQQAGGGDGRALVLVGRGWRKVCVLVRGGGLGRAWTSVVRRGDGGG